jgi:hypothetical protein
MKKVLLIAIFIVAISVNGFAKESPEDILRSLPPQIKSYNATDIVSYEDKRLGASLGYNSPAGIALNLYLYDLGVEDIKEGTDAEVISASKSMAVAEIMGFYSNVKIISDTEKTWKLNGRSEVKLLFLSLTYIMTNPYTGGSSSVVSDLYVTGLRGLICKVRISRPAGLGREDEDGITEMLRVMFSYLKK